ncbi:flagellar basal body P-ring formation chaperone FlgA [Devosia sp.]|uniref:flagellar basal body P-ring formation chaperone FlgA n=1 Tax=Devosia sp. TaxID=1871048 RepID=UPI003A8D4393
MTLKLTAAALLAALVGTAPALAELSLKTDVSVVSEIVTVGDMFDDAGMLAETALFRAPLPGTTGLVSIAAVRAAAERAGFSEFAADGIERVRVTRQAKVVDETVLDGLIVSDLTQRGLLPPNTEVELRFDGGAPSYNAEAVATPAELLTLHYAPGSTRFTARFAIAGTPQPVDVSGSITLMVAVPHLLRSVAAGEVISAQDLEMKRVPLQFAQQNGIDDVDQVVGKALMRNGRAGLMLRLADVTDPVVVTRNSAVTVLYRVGPLQLTMKGLALTAASAGQPVQVMNTASKKILHGIATAAGLVEVDDALTVAGL